MTSQEAQVRLRSLGANTFASKSERTWLHLVTAVIREPMLILLIAAGTINFLLAELADALLLMVTVLIVLAISIIQEWRSERAIQALSDLTAPLALVIRDGVERRVPSTQIVPGDLLLLLEGDRIVADARIESAAVLAIDESLLTGESIPVDKAAGDQVFAGSLVLRGHGRATVTATGGESELGKIGKSIQAIPYERSRLQSDIDRLVRIVGAFGFLTVIAIITTFGLTRSDWLQGALAGIAAAMALIPEEFPVILTLFFAIGAWRMARVRVIARKSPAIEALGAITVLCVDKTGTLTRNQMEITTLQLDHRQHDLRDGALPSEFHELARVAALAAPRRAFDPMDRAFQSLATELLALDRYESIQEFPVVKERLGYIHIWSHQGKLIAAAKGAPEYIAQLTRLDQSAKAELDRRVIKAAAEGFRVLAIAVSSCTDTSITDLAKLDFKFLGIALLHDPVRTGVPGAVSECAAAGIRTVMITGDHPSTAIAIATEIGLQNPAEVLTGIELDQLSDSELADRIVSTSVFARVRPEDKLRLIRALRANGEVVAMTGDGVNDAPALRAADIGIAMGGRGTDVAREAAALVITDDDFTSIVAGISRGRAIYANMQKAMSYVIAVHVPIFGMALAPVFVADWPLILLPALVAFHEVIIDPACSIVYEVEEPDPRIMQRQPRSLTVGIFTRGEAIYAFAQGTTLFFAVFAVFFNALASGQSDAKARSLTFATLLIGNLLLILANRSRNLTIVATIRQRRNRVLPWILGAAILLLLALLNLPFLKEAFELASLTPREYLDVILIAYLGICWTDLAKIMHRFKSGH